MANIFINSILDQGSSVFEISLRTPLGPELIKTNTNQKEGPGQTDPGQNLENREWFPEPAPGVQEDQTQDALENHKARNAVGMVTSEGKTDQYNAEENPGDKINHRLLNRDKAPPRSGLLTHLLFFPLPGSALDQAGLWDRLQTTRLGVL